MSGWYVLVLNAPEAEGELFQGSGVLRTLEYFQIFMILI